MTAYQITSMMEGVVQRGTATTLREVGKPIAGKYRYPPTMRKMPGSSASRPISRSASISASTSRGRWDVARPWSDGGANRARLHEGGSGRQARGSVSCAGRHQAHSYRPEERHACWPGSERVIHEAFKPGTAPPGFVFGRRLFGVGRAIVRAVGRPAPQAAPPPPAIDESVSSGCSGRGSGGLH